MTFLFFNELPHFTSTSTIEVCFKGRDFLIYDWLRISNMKIHIEIDMEISTRNYN